LDISIKKNEGEEKIPEKWRRQTLNKITEATSIQAHKGKNQYSTMRPLELPTHSTLKNFQKEEVET